jgi:hypothetical protein
MKIEITKGGGVRSITVAAKRYIGSIFKRRVITSEFKRRRKIIEATLRTKIVLSESIRLPLSK